MKHVDHNIEDACVDDEPMFLEELFKDECFEKTCVEKLKSKVSFEKKKLDLNIFTFDEPSNDHTFENMIQESLIDQNFKELFEDELIYLDESTRDALVHYTPPKKIVDLSVEVIFKDKHKFLDNHIVDTPIILCDNDEFMRSV